MDLSFDSNFSTAGENKSAKLYNEELENSPLLCDAPQAVFCHDGIVCREKGRDGGGRNERSWVAELS
jgi:hypothetical protein